MPDKLVIVSPFPPVSNGIADYVAELLPHHAADFDTYIVIANHQPEPDLNGLDVEVVLDDELLSRQDLKSAHYIYHIGNNADHIYQIPLLIQRPGVVVLHDFCLSYLLEKACEDAGSMDGYRVWAQHDYGAFGERLAEDFLKSGWRGRFMNFELALNGPILSNATALIVHSRYSQFKAAARRPGLPVHYLPHHVSPKVAEARSVSREEAREILDLPQDKVIVSALGFVTRNKFIERSLASLARIKPLVPDFQFVLAGERRIQEYNVNNDILASGLASQVTCTDYLDEEAFFHHLMASDLVLNMRFPIGGESSGTLARAIGCGRACVVLDYGPMGEMANGVVAKIPFDDRIDESLDNMLLKLLSNRHERHRVERNALEAGSQWTPRKSADRYHAVLANTPARSPSHPKMSLTAFSRTRPRTLVAEGFDPRGNPMSSHWWRYPITFQEELSGSARLLYVDDDAIVAKDWMINLGWTPGAFECVTTAYVVEGKLPADAVYDGLVLVVDAARPIEELQHLSMQLSAHLRWGSPMVVETTQDQSQDSSCTSQELLSALGGSHIHVYAQSEMSPELEACVDREERVWRKVGSAVKTSAVVAWHNDATSQRGQFRHSQPRDAVWLLS